jgi:hypothetical protein
MRAPAAASAAFLVLCCCVAFSPPLTDPAVEFLNWDDRYYSAPVHLSLPLRRRVHRLIVGVVGCRTAPTSSITHISTVRACHSPRRKPTIYQKQLMAGSYHAGLSPENLWWMTTGSQLGVWEPLSWLAKAGLLTASDATGVRRHKTPTKSVPLH